MERKDFLGLSISELGVGTYMVVGCSENTNQFLTYRPNIFIQLFTTAWRVPKVAFLFPILGKVLPRDLSPLKPILVEGAWVRKRKRLAPLSAGGAPPDEGFFRTSSWKKHKKYVF
jgi:hypothetical protein